MLTPNLPGYKQSCDLPVIQASKRRSPTPVKGNFVTLIGASPDGRYRAADSLVLVFLSSPSVLKPQRLGPMICMCSGAAAPRLLDLSPSHPSAVHWSRSGLAASELRQERANLQLKPPVGHPIKKHQMTRTNHSRMLVVVAAVLQKSSTGETCLGRYLASTSIRLIRLLVMLAQPRKALHD